MSVLAPGRPAERPRVGRDSRNLSRGFGRVRRRGVDTSLYSCAKGGEEHVRHAFPHSSSPLLSFPPLGPSDHLFSAPSRLAREREGYRYVRMCIVRSLPACLPSVVQVGQEAIFTGFMQNIQNLQGTAKLEEFSPYSMVKLFYLFWKF